MLSSETAEGTKIQFEQTKGVLGMNDGGELAITDNESVHVEFTLKNYLRDPKKFIQKEDVKSGYKGFLDILALQKKLPWSLGVKILYKFGLLVFFLINFLYPLIVFAVEQDNVAYNVVCFIISFIGLAFELYELLPDLYHYIKAWKEKQRKLKAENDVAAKKGASRTEVVIQNQDIEEAPQTEKESTDEPDADTSVEDEVETLDYSKKVNWCSRSLSLIH